MQRGIQKKVSTVERLYLVNPKGEVTTETEEKAKARKNKNKKTHPNYYLKSPFNLLLNYHKK